MSMMELRRDQRTTQSPSPRLQHAVRLLQMSSLDFACSMQDQLAQNPFLECADEHAPGDAVEPTDDAADDGVFDQPDADPAPDHENDPWLPDAHGAAAQHPDSARSGLEQLPQETSLAEHLQRQLNRLALAPRQRLLATLIVGSLDDDAYLRTPLAELLTVERLDPAVSLDELAQALACVQTLDPPGVAARSVAECLLLQLPLISCPQLQALARGIVTDHLPLLAARDHAALARRLAATPAQVAAAAACIRRLNPRPGYAHGSSRIDYVVPDVVAKKVRGQWQVQLNPATVPKLRLNQVVAELFDRHRNAQHAEMAGHLQAARWTLKNAALRFSTILEVSQAIVKRQQQFLDWGDMAMKPLALREIADEVGVHESTVSRVTNNKYIATPSGVFELKHFFSRAMTSANGRASSSTAIRGLVKELIHAEPAAAPLSDAEITRQLASQGLRVARRTVTKYRQLLNIDAVERRRRSA